MYRRVIPSCSKWCKLRNVAEILVHIHMCVTTCLVLVGQPIVRVWFVCKPASEPSSPGRGYCCCDSECVPCCDSECVQQVHTAPVAQLGPVALEHCARGCSCTQTARDCYAGFCRMMREAGLGSKLLRSPKKLTNVPRCGACQCWARHQVAVPACGPRRTAMAACVCSRV